MSDTEHVDDLEGDFTWGKSVSASNTAEVSTGGVDGTDKV